MKGFKVGDLAAVGCLVDSCLSLRELPRRARAVLRQRRHHLHLQQPGQEAAGRITYGGYSNRIVVDEQFCLRLPDKLDPAAAAPLLCAGITTYSPLKHWRCRQGAEGRHRRARRAGPHGREARPRLRRPHGAVHDLAGQDRGREAPRRGRGRRLEGRRRR